LWLKKFIQELVGVMENFRILLWDIDGTLMRSTRSGLFMEYTGPALKSVFGTVGRLAEIGVSGMTDLQIFAEALRNEGITHEHIHERAEEVKNCFMLEMQRVVRANENLFYLLPGVRAILQAVDADPRYLSSLLTGNIEAAAYLKLKLVGLSEFFSLPGAFGDDSHKRRDLPALAAERINKHLGMELKPYQFIVIGDTPNDIDCARYFGARVIAVATGRSHTVSELITHNPDVVLEDLSDTELVMRTLSEL
jgi:phosphoglycolate phosphatase